MLIIKEICKLVILPPAIYLMLVAYLLAEYLSAKPLLPYLYIKLSL